MRQRVLTTSQSAKQLLLKLKNSLALPKLSLPKTTNSKPITRKVTKTKTLQLQKTDNKNSIAVLP